MDADIDDESCDYSCIGDSAAANDPNATLPGDCVYCDQHLHPDCGRVRQLRRRMERRGVLPLQPLLVPSRTRLHCAAFTGDGLNVGTDYVCLAPGCYNFQVLDDVTQVR